MALLPMHQSEFKFSIWNFVLDYPLSTYLIRELSLKTRLTDKDLKEKLQSA